jgi:hypothetical protein
MWRLALGCTASCQKYLTVWNGTLSLPMNCIIWRSPGSSTTSPIQACSTPLWRCTRLARQTRRRTPYFLKKIKAIWFRREGYQPDWKIKIGFMEWKDFFLKVHGMERWLTLSLYLSCGTGTPDLRSLVMHRGLSPPLSQALITWTAFCGGPVDVALLLLLNRVLQQR